MAEAANKDVGPVFYNIVAPQRVGPLVISAYTHIGKRGNQEDRLVVAPSIFGGEYAFFGIFDGTVKEYASDFVHKHILDCLLASKSFRQFDALSDSSKKGAESGQLLQDCLTETYAATDAKLLQWCRDNANHYSSTTAVTVLIHLPSQRMAVAHIGDSKIILGTVELQTPEQKQDPPLGRLVGHALTTDHKPDMRAERARIEACGGSLTYLHGGKPFIRGGDFSQRKHAMQLNYSRAFGGKDLKCYGLSAVPDVALHTLQDNRERMVILGSDGIWDVMTAEQAVALGEHAQQQQLSPAEELSRVSLRNHVTKGSADNVTAICCFFDFASQKR